MHNINSKKNLKRKRYISFPEGTSIGTKKLALNKHNVAHTDVGGAGHRVSYHTQHCFQKRSMCSDFQQEYHKVIFRTKIRS